MIVKREREWWLVCIGHFSRKKKETPWWIDELLDSPPAHTHTHTQKEWSNQKFLIHLCVSLFSFLSSPNKREFKQNLFWKRIWGLFIFKTKRPKKGTWAPDWPDRTGETRPVDTHTHKTVVCVVATSEPSCEMMCVVVVVLRLFWFSCCAIIAPPLQALLGWKNPTVK
jgi:hypothetical protein